ncbi:tetratricopeptide repeat protein [Cobetia marina]
MLYRQPNHENALKLLHESTIKAAQDALRRRSFEYAEIKISESLALDNPLEVAWRISAQIAYEKKDFIMAMQRLQLALQKGSDNPALRLLQVKILRAIGYDSEALRVINNSLSHWPMHPVLQCLQLDLLRDSGKVSEAFPTLRTIQRQEDSYPSVILAAARFYASFNRLHVAINLLERVLRLQSNHTFSKLLYWTVLAKKSEAQFSATVKSTWYEYFSKTELQSNDIKELAHVVSIMSKIDFTNSNKLYELYLKIVDCLIVNNVLLSEKESYEILEIAYDRGDTFIVDRVMQYIFYRGPKNFWCSKETVLKNY